MTRRKGFGILVLAASCVLAGAPVHAMGQSAAQARDVRSKSTVKTVPLSADATVTRTVVGADGQARTERETSHLYRDSGGRTREETGSLVTINDPATRTTLRLNTRTRTYQKTTGSQATTHSTLAAPSLDAALKPVISPLRNLGTARVSGVLAQGEAYTITSPRPGAKPVTKEVTIWGAAGPQLNVMTQIVESTGARYTQTYTNIASRAEAAAGLFTLPAGYREGAVTSATSAPTGATSATGAATGAKPATAQAACPLASQPDPLFLFDFGVGLVEATTDLEQGCIFTAHAWAFVFPLEIWPALNPPLPGIPYDAFIAFDDLGPVPCPFLPCSVPGDITFLAQNTTDSTIKDSAVILTVFGF